MKRRQITVAVTLSLAPGVSVREAKRELRTRCNDLCCYGGTKFAGDPWKSEPVEEPDVRVRKIGPFKS